MAQLKPEYLILSVILLALVLVIWVWIKNKYPTKVQCEKGNPCNLDWAIVQYINGKLWYDHVAFTREYLISKVRGDNDAVVGEKVARLMQNQDDIGEFLALFWGEESGAAVTTLLKEHITIADQIVAASLAGGQTDILIETWQLNSTEIANSMGMLSQGIIVPSEMEAMMFEHLQLTLDEFAALNNGSSGIVEYDAVIAQSLTMGRTLGNALAIQFGF